MSFGYRQLYTLHKNGRHLCRHYKICPSILEISIIVMYEFWYDYMKPKYTEKAKLCHMNTDSFILYMKIEDIYADITKDFKTRFDSSNYELDRPLPKGKNKKVIGLMKKELGDKRLKEFTTLRGKTYRYLTDNKDEEKKTQKTVR